MKTTKIVQFLNEHYHDNNQLVCKWLTDYIHSSCTYTKQNIDGSWLKVQPAWPEYEVIEYRYYPDNSMTFSHHTNRFVLYFTGRVMYDISIYKFKRYLRRMRISYEKMILSIK